MKPVSEMTDLEILDKNVDQEQLGLDLFEKHAGGPLRAKIDQLKADIESGKIDLIPGTTVDNVVLAQIVDGVAKALGIQ